MTWQRVLGFVVLAAATALSRLIPHPPNMTGASAAALIGGKEFGAHGGMAIALSAAVVTDLIIGFYDWKLMAAVYGAYALIALIGPLVARARGVLPLFVGALGSALLFFLLSNFAVWLFSPWYDKTLEGLIRCFTLALPFFKNSLIGMLFYTALFAAGAWMARRAPTPAYCSSSYAMILRQTCYDRVRSWFWTPWRRLRRF